MSLELRVILLSCPPAAAAGWWTSAWELSLSFHRQPPPSVGNLHSLRFLPPNPLMFRGSPQQPSMRGTPSGLLAQSCSFHWCQPLLPAEAASATSPSIGFFSSVLFSLPLISISRDYLLQNLLALMSLSNLCFWGEPQARPEVMVIISDHFTEEIHNGARGH